jgi:hypothetical protein
MTIPRDCRVCFSLALVVALFMSNYVCISKAQIKPEAFHRIVGGDQVDLYTLKNSNGLDRYCQKLCIEDGAHPC